MAIATKPTNTQLTIPAEDTLTTIEAIVAECGLSAGDDGTHFVRAVKRAAGIKALRALLKDEFMKDFVMPLQGSRLGFRTDKDRDGGYALNVVRDCAIECLLQGGHLTGNEFNIIAGNTYFTKEFFERAVGEIPGLTDLKLMDGVPQRMGDGALVSYVATWKMHGREQCLECIEIKGDGTASLDTRIAVRVNQGMGVDAILGKAKRKMLARIYNQATGSNIWEGEADDSQPSSPAASLSDLTRRLTGQADNTLATAGHEQPVANGAPAQTVAAPEPETEPEATTDPGEVAASQEDLLDETNQRLDGCSTLLKVNEVEKWALERGLPEAQVRQMCDARRDEIRETRGK